MVLSHDEVKESSKIIPLNRDVSYNISVSLDRNLQKSKLISFNSYLTISAKNLRHRLTCRFQTLMGNSGYHNRHFDIK